VRYENRTVSLLPGEVTLLLGSLGELCFHPRRLIRPFKCPLHERVILLPVVMQQHCHALAHNEQRPRIIHRDLDHFGNLHPGHPLVISGEMQRIRWSAKMPVVRRCSCKGVSFADRQFLEKALDLAVLIEGSGLF
jgi:hypothetical protein